MSARLGEHAETLSVGYDYEDFFENGSVGLHLVGGDGRIILANKAELGLLGYAEQDYVGRPIADFHVDADVIEDILRRLAGGERVDKRPARLRYMQPPNWSPTARSTGRLSPRRWSRRANLLGAGAA